jgi:hypothetical protein
VHSTLITTRRHQQVCYKEAAAAADEEEVAISSVEIRACTRLYSSAHQRSVQLL